MKDFYRNLLQLINAGQPVAWATMIRSRGSTPQKPGSSAVLDHHAILEGTVGGGIMEADVVNLTRPLLKTRESKLIRFNLDGSPEDEGAICGGEAEVLIDASPANHSGVLEALEDSLSQKNRGSLVTLVSRPEDEVRNVERFWIKEGDSLPSGTRLSENILQLIKEYTDHGAGADWWIRDIPESMDPEFELIFAERIRPLPQLIIAGAGHIGKALAHLGSLLDFEVTVIDDRPEYANKNQLPDADHIVVKDIREAMEELHPGPDDYCVLVTRGHQHDEEALKPLIGSDAAYIGMIGSRHKVGVMKHEFIRKGWATPDQWEQIYAPIGLPIGSKTIQEIAFSIAGQLVQVRQQNNQRYGR